MPDNGYSRLVEERRDSDPEFAATLHILDHWFFRGRIEEHVKPAARQIDFPALLAMGWSTGEQAMLEIACAMWGREDIAEGRFSPVLTTLDDGCFDRIIEAMYIRRRRARGA